MFEVPVTVFFWLVEVFTLGFVSRGKKRQPSAATVFKSLFFHCHRGRISVDVSIYRPVLRNKFGPEEQVRS